MIFNPRDGGRLVLHVDEGSLVIDVKSARVAYQNSSMEARSQSKTVIRLDCDMEGTLVYKDTKEDRTEAIILHGEKDSPEAVVLVAKNLDIVNVSMNFPGVTEITIEAYGLPIQYSKMVEQALQEKKKVPDSRIAFPQSVLEAMQKKWINDHGYVIPTGQTLKSAFGGAATTSSHDHNHLGGGMIGHTLTASQLPGITDRHVIRPSPVPSTKVWPRVLTDEEIINDQED